MDLIVCGGRDFKNRDQMFRHLDTLHRLKPITRLIHGGQRGADFMSGTWALSRQVPSVAVLAEWGRLGKAAGHNRNCKMLRLYPEAEVLAFPTGGPGTANMIKECIKLGRSWTRVG